MTDVTRFTILPASFRGRFLLVVLFAAVVPLALIGVWLTRSVVRAGEDLLRSELNRSLDKISAAVIERWSYQRGDLELRPLPPTRFSPWSASRRWTATGLRSVVRSRIPRSI